MCILQKSYLLWEFQADTLYEILTINVVSGIVYFREIILESTRNVSETTHWNGGLHLAEVMNDCG